METSTTEQLIHATTTKAGKAFLWVVLAVARLPSELLDDDTFSDLLRRLEELPPSLETFYHLMLGSMSPLHSHQFPTCRAKYGDSRRLAHGRAAVIRCQGREFCGSYQDSCSS